MDKNQIKKQGTIKKWNDQRGFGFIVMPEEKRELFFHISDFPAEGGRPNIGEAVLFTVTQSADGKVKATDIECPDRPVSKTRSIATAEKNSSARYLVKVFACLLLAAFIAFSVVKQTNLISAFNTEHPARVETRPPYPESSYRCDGRKYCSQMHSCNEARYFNTYCPGSKMDGDGDGTPCESQWCK